MKYVFSKNSNFPLLFINYLDPHQPSKESRGLPKMGYDCDVNELYTAGEHHLFSLSKKKGKKPQECHLCSPTVCFTNHLCWR